MDKKITFTAYLEDKYTKRFEELARTSSQSIKDMDRSLSDLPGTGRKAAMSIEDINKRLVQLSRMRKITVDTSALSFMNKEIKSLQKEKQKLEEIGTGEDDNGGGGGMGSLLGKGGLVLKGAQMLGSAIKYVGEKVLETTPRYERFEAVLTNSIGNSSLATEKMNEITRWAANTPYKVDAVTESFVKMAGSGFMPTIREMDAMADLAANSNEPFEKLAEAVVEAQSGDFSKLKEFGISAKETNDQLTLTFQDQAREVANTSAAIRDYITSVGESKGVAGAMANQGETTGTQMQSLNNNIELFYQSLGQRFQPAISGSIGALNSMVIAIRDWADLNPEDRINSEATHLRVLQARLNSTNTSEESRKEILGEMERIHPKILDGIDKEAISYGKLNENIQDVIGSMREKAKIAGLKKKIDEAQEEANEYAGFQNEVAEDVYGIAEREGYDFQAIMTSKSEDIDKMKAILAGLLERDERGEHVGFGDIRKVRNAIWRYESFDRSLDQISARIEPTQKKYREASSFYKSLLADQVAPPPPAAPKDDDKGGKPEGGASIVGETRVTHVTISINNLVGGGVNIYSTTVKEGASSMTDHVKEALITAVNDSQLAIGR